MAAASKNKLAEISEGIGKSGSNQEDTIVDCEPITQVLETMNIQIILENNNDSDYIYCTQDEPVNLLSKRKAKEERRHAVIKIDIQ